MFRVTVSRPRPHRGRSLARLRSRRRRPLRGVRRIISSILQITFTIQNDIYVDISYLESRLNQADFCFLSWKTPGRDGITCTIHDNFNVDSVIDTTVEIVENDCGLKLTLDENDDQHRRKYAITFDGRNVPPETLRRGVTAPRAAEYQWATSDLTSPEDP